MHAFVDTFWMFVHMSVVDRAFLMIFYDKYFVVSSNKYGALNDLFGATFQKKRILVCKEVSIGLLLLIVISNDERPTSAVQTYETITTGILKRRLNKLD